ncbi:MAG: hypothetical protein M1838_001230 [Thelocarpon superellum]|nr:MAG: hypothetical protein M1838_001230 [Thelocarpon superellum]
MGVDVDPAEAKIWLREQKEDARWFQEKSEQEARDAAWAQALQNEEQASRTMARSSMPTTLSSPPSSTAQVWPVFTSTQPETASIHRAAEQTPATTHSASVYRQPLRQHLNMTPHAGSATVIDLATEEDPPLAGQEIDAAFDDDVMHLLSNPMPVDASASMDESWSGQRVPLRDYRGQPSVNPSLAAAGGASRYGSAATWLAPDVYQTPSGEIVVVGQPISPLPDMPTSSYRRGPQHGALSGGPQYEASQAHATNLRDVIANNPFDLSDLGPLQSPRWTSRQAEYYDYVANDPTKTREELKTLLENIRPDAELPPENREGTPEAMKYPLMEHQKLGLAWMKSMEEGSNKGGILADDMGLGKTIQALALLVSRPSTDAQRKTTLVVAPVALMKQWEREIATKLKPSHRLRTFTLHGAKRNAHWKLLREYDVVLTTFGTLASELKKLRGHAAAEEGATGPPPHLPLLGTESKWYRVIVDEAQCIKNRTTKAALGACALKALTRFCLTGTPMMNGVSELQSLIEFLRIKPYHEAVAFQRAFTTPLRSTSATSYDQAMRKLQALLKAILLRRTKRSEIDGKPIINLPARTNEIRHVVFDDAQQEFYTALETQTRLQFNRFVRQNAVGRNYSNVLVLLLRLRQACCHPHLITDFAQEVLNNGDLSPEDMLRVATELAPDVVARIRETEAFECPVCYDAVENPAIFIPCGHDTCAECFAKISDQSNMQGLAQGSETSEVRCPQCRGRIASKKTIDYISFKKVHMAVTTDASEKATSPDAEGDSDSETDADSEADETDSSLDGFIVADDEDDTEGGGGRGPTRREKVTSTGKGHGKKRDTKGKGKAKAPSKSLAQLKKEGMRNAKARTRYMRRLGREWIPSAKVEKCCEILEQIQAASTGEKTIVFSQFTSLLDLVEIPIARKNWGFKRYDGSMSTTQRNNAVMEFTDKADCKIMLVSLKAGNAGLNLVAASQVIILDPFWNPFIEEQAVDRTHRIGQLRPVKVHRILVQGTVEDRIIALQDKKRALIEGALDEKASEKIGRLGLRELTFLFGADGGI